MASDRPIPPELMWDQFKTICASDQFRNAPQQKERLEYLLKMYEKGIEVKGAVMAADMEKKNLAEIKDKDWAYIRAACMKIRQKLARYYGDHTGPEDPVIISMVRGVVGVSCSLRSSEEQKRTDPVMHLVNSKRAVDCRCLGNDSEAMQYVLEKYRGTDPKLIGLRDTHVRFKVRPPGEEGYYDELQTEFTKFLRAGKASVTKCTIIFGQEVDKAYVEMVQNAARGTGDQLKCHLLKSPVPLMNFIVMRYAGGGAEILFGWGGGAVFASRDEKLVTEFNNFYEVLLNEAAEKVEVASILERLVGDRPETPEVNTR